MSNFKKHIEMAIKREPHLCRYGIGLWCFDEHKLLTSGERFKQSQKELFNEEKTFLLCVEWLAAQKTIKRPQKSSYFYKHVVERCYKTYIPNGAFIAALIYMDIKYTYQQGPNVYAHLSKKLNLYDGVPVA